MEQLRSEAREGMVDECFRYYAQRNAKELAELLKQ